MTKLKTSIKTFLLCSFLGACIGFFLGGGWRILFDYSQWHYEISMHANDVEETLAFINWCCSGPAPGALIGAIAGMCLPFLLVKKTTRKSGG